MTIDGSLLQAVRHNSWANDELLTFCAGRPPEELAWSAPGTYGTIHQTLHHLVGAEHGYLYTLTGRRPPIEEERGGRRMSGDWLAPLDELAERARSNAERIERVLTEDFDPARVLRFRDEPGSTKAGIIVAQLIHHGTDHRAHIATILGSNGVTPPELDVWAYGIATGDVVVSS